VLARVVYKQHCALRRIDILDRVKAVVRLIDKFLANPADMLPNISMIIVTVERASERFFQQLTKGLMIPMSTVCLGSLARISEILKRIPPGGGMHSVLECDDVGERVER
jgi:hypothetical protein